MKCCRTVLASMLLLPLGRGPLDAQKVEVTSGSVAETVKQLKAGQYVWLPEIAPEGPMLFIINLKTQHALLYRNGVPIGATTVSTGRQGRETPTGVFTILEKQIVHHSSKYDNAPMPYMERLTWQGVALHAGHLPGYPASHGCIRMPAGFAKLLYGVTSIGMTVVIADVPAAPRVAPTPALLSADTVSIGSGETISWTPEKAPRGPVSVVVSSSDHRAVVLRNGVIIGSAPVSVAERVTGTFAYALKSVDQQGQHWVRVALSAPSRGNQNVPREEWQKFKAPDVFKKDVASIVAPGMTIVVTPDSLRSAAAPATVLESGS